MMKCRAPARMQFQFLDAVDEAAKMSLEIGVAPARSLKLSRCVRYTELISGNADAHQAQHREHQFPLQPSHETDTAGNHPTIDTDLRNRGYHACNAGDVVREYR